MNSFAVTAAARFFTGAVEATDGIGAETAGGAEAATGGVQVDAEGLNEKVRALGFSEAAFFASSTLAPSEDMVHCYMDLIYFDEEKSVLFSIAFLN